MAVKQLSVYIENKKGTISDITDLLAGENIDLRSLCIADTKDFGILRIIADEPEASAEKLREGGYIVNVTEVIAVGIKDAPGSLAAILEIIAAAGVSVEYTYAFLATRISGAVMIFRVDDGEKAAAALKKAGIRTVDQAEIF